MRAVLRGQAAGGSGGCDSCLPLILVCFALSQRPFFSPEPWVPSFLFPRLTLQPLTKALHDTCLLRFVKPNAWFFWRC